MMSDAIALLVFGGVVGFIFAVKTSEAPWAFLFYTAGSAACFALAIKFILEY